MEPWHIVYRKLAEQLSVFYNTFGHNSGEEIYQRGIHDKAFSDAHGWLKKYRRNERIKSVDPIQLFTSINESTLSDKTRVARVKNLFRILSSEYRPEEINFSGCPAPVAIKIMSARTITVQQEIWSLFDKVVRKKQSALDQEVFSKLLNWYGISIISFTIFLFWIDSDNFLPLDKNTIYFLIECGVLQKRPKDCQSYRKLIPKSNTQLYRTIAHAAFNVKRESPEWIITANKIRREYKTAKRTGLRQIDFKIVAIRPLQGLSPNYLKVLKVDQVYTFYSSYDFSKEDQIIYDNTHDLRLYDIIDSNNPIKINVSAIVGKNGSGKSSIAELLYLAVNNIAARLLEKSESDLVEEEDIFLEMFYNTDTLHKLSIKGKNITLQQYSTRDGRIFRPGPFLELSKQALGLLFYTVAINYSHYALNSRDLTNDWIQPLFHKNDAYQTPLVLNPMRTEGNININIENSLVKSRLLSNILEPVEEGTQGQNLRTITENGRSVQKITLNINGDKFKKWFQKDGFPDREDIVPVLENVYRIFKVDQKPGSDKYSDHELYIFKKLISICKNYSHYGAIGGFDFKRDLFKKDESISLIKALWSDRSHITYKLRQSINAVKFGHYDDIQLGEKTDVETLSEIIQELIKANPNDKLKVIELIPPSFYITEMELSDGSSFNMLSSGEKQRIYSVSSLVYHLINLNSISETKNLVKYPYINIFFDEVELYFHPDMQRTFIDYLLQYIKRANLDEIDGINICFATHSPFILSDIPNYNVMFLERKEEKNSAVAIQISEKENERLTFGSNIHELLTTRFFLHEQGLIGEFAKGKIHSAIRFLTEKDTEKKLANQEWDNKSLRAFIDIIGEPLIKNGLKDLYEQEYLSTDESITAEIKRLQDKLKKNK